MSEKISFLQHEQHKVAHEVGKDVLKDRHDHTKHPQPEVQYSKEKIYQAIEQHSVQHDKIPSSKDTAHHERPHHYITQEVKRSVYTHTIKNVQKQLSIPEQTFSKIVHNSTVETLSEVGANTIARPSAIIGGGLLMVCAGLALLAMARYYGFTIPLSSLLFFYAVGFALLFVIDMISKPMRKRLKKRGR